MRAGCMALFLIVAGLAYARPGLDDAIRDYSGQQPVFPGAEGFGTATPAGRGGAVLRVTTLAADGPGSLREALAAQGPRVVVFEVGGVIDIKTPLMLESPNVTVAGQTAPPPGITIIGAGLIIQASDILIQHLRIRVGDRPEGPDPGGRDALSIYPGGDGNQPTCNVVIDHCSFSWAVDECTSMWGTCVSDVTFRQCIIAEGLSHSTHPEIEHSKGLLIGDHARRIAVIGNLFAHNQNRNPFVKGDVSALLVNNVVYDPGELAIHFGDREKSGPSKTTAIGNVFIPGPSTEKHVLLFTLLIDLHRGTRVYAMDNDAGGRPLYIGLRPKSMWTEIAAYNDSPVRVAPLTLHPSAAALEWVLASAGARPAQRDACDTRVVGDVRAKTGRIIDHPGDVGGYPADAPAEHTLQLPADPQGDADGDGYTNLEEWLNAAAAAVETGGK